MESLARKIKIVDTILTGVPFLGTVNTALQLLYKLALKVQCLNPNGCGLKAAIALHVNTKSALSYCTGLIPGLGTAYVLWRLFLDGCKIRSDLTKNLTGNGHFQEPVKNAILNNARAVAISNRSDVLKTADALVAWRAWTTKKWKNLFETSKISEEEKKRITPLFAA